MKCASAVGPKDEIRQWEIAACVHLQSAENALLLDFKRRLEAGAAVEDGPYCLEPDHTTMADLEEERLKGGCGGVGGNGFYAVGLRYEAPAADPKPAADRAPAKRKTKHGSTLKVLKSDIRTGADGGQSARAAAGKAAAKRAVRP